MLWMICHLRWANLANKNELIKVKQIINLKSCILFYNGIIVMLIVPPCTSVVVVRRNQTHIKRQLQIILAKWVSDEISLWGNSSSSRSRNAIKWRYRSDVPKHFLTTSVTFYDWEMQAFSVLRNLIISFLVRNLIFVLIKYNQLQME